MRSLHDDPTPGERAMRHDLLRAAATGDEYAEAVFDAWANNDIAQIHAVELQYHRKVTIQRHLERMTDIAAFLARWAYGSQYM